MGSQRDRDTTSMSKNLLRSDPRDLEHPAHARISREGALCSTMSQMHAVVSAATRRRWRSRKRHLSIEVVELHCALVGRTSR